MNVLLELPANAPSCSPVSTAHLPSPGISTALFHILEYTRMCSNELGYVAKSLCRLKVSGQRLAELQCKGAHSIPAVQEGRCPAAFWGDLHFIPLTDDTTEIQVHIHRYHLYYRRCIYM